MYYNCFVYHLYLKNADYYIGQILNDENEGSSQPTLGKKFWKYIKSRKKDSVGVSPLQNEKGEHVIDSKEKAEILNSQIQQCIHNRRSKQHT